MSDRTIENGYEAVSKIKAAQVKLSGLIEEAAKLSDEVSALQNVNKGLTLSHTNFETTSTTVKDAVEKLKDILSELPEAIESKVKERLQSELETSEARMVEKTRTELQDTRATIRDTLSKDMRQVENELLSLGEELKFSKDKTEQLETSLKKIRSSANLWHLTTVLLLLILGGAEVAQIPDAFQVFSDLINRFN